MSLNRIIDNIKKDDDFYSTLYFFTDDNFKENNSLEFVLDNKVLMKFIFSNKKYVINTNSSNDSFIEYYFSYKFKQSTTFNIINDIIKKNTINVYKHYISFVCPNKYKNINLDFIPYNLLITSIKNDTNIITEMKKYHN